MKNVDLSQLTILYWLQLLTQDTTVYDIETILQAQHFNKKENYIFDQWWLKQISEISAMEKLRKRYPDYFFFLKHTILMNVFKYR